MATREETLSQAGSHFSRSLSARSIGSNHSKNSRYANVTEDENRDDDDDDALVDELLDESPRRNNNMKALAEYDDEFAAMDRLNDDVEDMEPELIAVRNTKNRTRETAASVELDGQENNEDDPYLNPLCKPAITVGSMNIGYSRAKMFGLCDNSGGTKLGTSGIVPPLSAKTKQRLDKISKPREIDAEMILAGVDDEENEARANLKKEAEKAMRNPKCGYDFVNRLKERGDFLNRAGDKGGKGTEKAKLDTEEQDYDARLDKLACPTCKRTQTFAEYNEKRRYCSQCKEKFTKLNLCNVNSFEKRMKAAELAKQEKLAALDQEVYKPANQTKKFVLGVGMVSVGEDGKLPKDVLARSAATAAPVHSEKLGPKAITVISELADNRRASNARMQSMVDTVTNGNRRTDAASSAGNNNKKSAATMSEEDIRTQKFNKLTMYKDNQQFNQTAPVNGKR
jgi:ribosomal protein L37AE/L43A